MEFEKAINEASTLLLFDRRSQQQLQEMADAATPRTRDWYLIRLTQAAFAYYNAVEAELWDVRGSIRQASRILREVKSFRQDRVFYTLALRLEVDLLMHTSALAFQEADKRDALKHLFQEEDERALSICDTLLKNFPPSLEPLPNAWYTSLIPIFPSFRDHVLMYYKDRIKDNRIVPLTGILKQVQRELTIISGVIQAKRYLTQHAATLRSMDKVKTLLLSQAKAVAGRLEHVVPALLQISTDVSLPKGITGGMLDAAIAKMANTVQEARAAKDMKKYTTSLMQEGILNFLKGDNPEAVQALVQTLRVSEHIDPADKKFRQFRYKEFPDIPFMIGTSLLRHSRAQKPFSEEEQTLLRKSVTALAQALVLQPTYHHGYINLMMALVLMGEQDTEAIEEMYLGNFQRDFAQINGLAYRNRAFLEFTANSNATSPEFYKWLILSQFCMGGEQTHAKKMLQELKTLYILNAHEFSAAYLNEYRTALRMKDQEFVADLADDELHSAILFYIAHAYGSLSLSQDTDEEDISLNHANLDRSVELNAEALYFNNRNSSAVRLVDTQVQIVQFGLRRSERRWENINNTIGQRFQYYEDYLRLMKSYDLLKERMQNLNLTELVPELTVSATARNKMASTINTEQRERLQQRVTMA
ncbi:MAG: hypothetical protein HY342_07800 [Candidatus Lambdaproteobacteria bacterium]|nr:hypothetical protein [Candidatus Lambdaproteobacteria bacterium]